MKLSSEQMIFLENHGVSMEKVFDATNMKRAEYSDLMKQGGYVVAIGVTKCTKAGHTMRTRSGNCVQCNPASIAFQSRYEKSMFVYIAQPTNASFVKVGITDDLADRERQLNLHKLGGFTSWKIKFSQRCREAGTVENKIHELLSKYNHPVAYQSREGVSKEVFNCSYEQAHLVVLSIINEYF